MKPSLDMEKIAKGLGADRLGPLTAKGGHFGALQAAAEVQARFRVPAGGGRPTDPSWTERRLVPFTPETLTRLVVLAERVRQIAHLNIEPLQLAGFLLEKAAERADEEQVEDLVRSHRSGS